MNTLRDLDLASVFARQAAVTIKAGRVERDTAELLRQTLARLARTPRRMPRHRGGGRRGRHATWTTRAAGACGRWPTHRHVRGTRRPTSWAWSRRSSRRSRAGPPVRPPAPSAGEPGPPRLERAVRRGQPRGAPPRRPWGRMDRAWAFGVSTVAAACRDHRLRRRARPPGGRRPPRRERRGRACRRRLGGRPHPADGRGGPRDGVRRDHPRPGAGGGHRVRPRPRAGQPRQRRRVRHGPVVDDRAVRCVASPNLSLSSRSDAFFGPLHELADEAYFRNVLLVAAANNVSVASYPSLYAAVVSVAAHDLPSPDAWFYNPAPRSSSADTGSTSTSPGGAARGWS